MQGSPHRSPQQSPQHFHQHPRGHQHASLRHKPVQPAQLSQATAAANKPKTYNPRHPERTLLYKTVAEHFETWLELSSAGQFDGQCGHHTPAPYVDKAFRKYLECGIFARGFARVRCDDCGDDHLVAFSCKGRGVCPSCNTRRMAEAAAHLSDHAESRLTPPASAPMAVISAQTAALLLAARQGRTQCGAAHLSARGAAKPANPLPRRCKG